MQSGFTVAEIYQTYIRNSRERDAIEGAIPPVRRIAGTMFEHRDLQYMVESIQRERTTLDTTMARYRRRQNAANEAAPVVPAVIPA
jgi:hypothetical protein